MLDKLEQKDFQCEMNHFVQNDALLGTSGLIQIPLLTVDSQAIGFARAFGEN